MGTPHLWGLMSVVQILTLPRIIPAVPVVSTTCEVLQSTQSLRSVEVSVVSRRVDVMIVGIVPVSRARSLWMWGRVGYVGLIDRVGRVPQREGCPVLA